MKNRSTASVMNREVRSNHEANITKPWAQMQISNSHLSFVQVAVSYVIPSGPQLLSWPEIPGPKLPCYMSCRSRTDRFRTAEIWVSSDWYLDLWPTSFASRQPCRCMHRRNSNLMRKKRVAKCHSPWICACWMNDCQ